MLRITDILDQAGTYLNPEDLEIIEKAYIYSATVHQGQVRLSGEPYLTHPLTVAWILADMELDEETVAAGLLHDILEDTPTTAEELETEFGPAWVGKYPVTNSQYQRFLQPENFSNPKLWLDFPKKSRWAINAHRIARVLGLLGLVWLALVGFLAREHVVVAAVQRLAAGDAGERPRGAVGWP